METAWGPEDFQPRCTWRTGEGLLPLSGQVLICTLCRHVVQLDLVADAGRLPTGTPFVVEAEVPSERLRLLVEPLLTDWSRDRVAMNALITRHHGRGRVALGHQRTLIVLDFRALALPPMPAAA